ncbi:MAG: hypothetical protein PWQ66_948 [Petrotoga sp.]|jgi:hypothetical protein|nr:hypothetical protein [Petrotoga sp.]
MKFDRALRKNISEKAHTVNLQVKKILVCVIEEGNIKIYF